MPLMPGGLKADVRDSHSASESDYHLTVKEMSCENVLPMLQRARESGGNALNSDRVGPSLTLGFATACRLEEGLEAGSE